MNKVLKIIKDILLAVIPIIRKDKRVEDSIILILEIAVVILGVILAR